MRRRVALVAAASCLAVALAIAAGWGGTAAAVARNTRTVHVQTAAWYAEAGPCSVVDCSGASANPYPEDTLHVALSGGQENARTYLSFSFGVPSGGTLTGGTLLLPVDANPDHGSIAPDQAQIEACLVTENFKPVRGSLAAPPKADCDTSSAATYDDKRAVFSVDLLALSSSWTTGDGALALVSTEEAQQAGGTWHAVFPASSKESKGAPAITAKLTFTTPSTGGGGGGSPTSSGTGTSGGTPTGTTSGGGTFTGGGGVSGYGSFGSPSTSTTTTTTTTVTGGTGQPGVQTVPVQSVEGYAGPGFAYPLVWALPLAFLFGFGAVGRALTKELYRRGV